MIIRVRQLRPLNSINGRELKDRSPRFKPLTPNFSLLNLEWCSEHFEGLISLIKSKLQLQGINNDYRNIRISLGPIVDNSILPGDRFKGYAHIQRVRFR